jgi:hypothetical protein
MKKAPGQQPSSETTKRLATATKVLAGLLPLSANGIIIDTPETIRFFTRLSYRFADELLKYEDVNIEDIPEGPPSFPKVSQLVPGQIIGKHN